LKAVAGNEEVFELQTTLIYQDFWKYDTIEVWESKIMTHQNQRHKVILSTLKLILEEMYKILNHNK
jgi:hypothetical protein